MRAVGDRAARRRSAARTASRARWRRPARAGGPSAARRSVRLTRCPASGSTQRGSIRAAVRPHSRDVSTSSATITQPAGAAPAPSPGKSAKRAPRAPRYSRRRGVAQADVRQQPGQQRLVDRRRGSAGVVVERARRPPWPPGAAGRRGPATRGCAGSAGTRPCSRLRNWLPDSSRWLLAQVAPEVQVGEEVRARRRRSARAAGRPAPAGRPGARAGPGSTARRR